MVTTTADSGPGSLRQAILDSNSVTGGTNTIDFAIPGQGVQTIAPASPLPTITNAVLDRRLVPARIRRRAADRAQLPVGRRLRYPADRQPERDRPRPGEPGLRGRHLDAYRIDTTTDERLVAQVHAEGITTQLLLLDAQGHLLMQSDGQSPVQPR